VRFVSQRGEVAGLIGSAASAAVMIGRIARSARHLRALVDDLLDISRMEAGRVTLEVEEVSLPALARDTVAAPEPRIARH
jgi:signal transduction histidine kinase